MKIRTWKKSNATDQDIKNCLGDFIGCTECRYFKRCHELLFEEIKNEHVDCKTSLHINHIYYDCEKNI